MRESNFSQQKLYQQLEMQLSDQMEKYSREHNRFVYLNIDKPDEPLKQIETNDKSPRKIYTIIEQIPEMKESRDNINTNLNFDLKTPEYDNLASESILTNEHIRTTL